MSFRTTGQWATCAKCGGEFVRDAPWKKICINCWKQLGTRKGGKVQELELRLAQARGRVLQLEAQLEKAQAAQMDEGMLAWLLRLCHPDRHGGSEMATTATQWLLRQRQKDGRHVRPSARRRCPRS